MTVRCAVLGQSNSLAKSGYLGFLSAHPHVEIVRSAGLGASPSVIAPFFVDDGFFRDCDFCVIDLSVVDVPACQRMAYHYRSIVCWAEWMCHMARKNGCQPLVLAIPLSHLVFSDHIVVRLYREVCHALQCHYLDVGDLVRLMPGVGAAEAVALYKDPSHPGERLSRIMGDTIAAFLQEAAGRTLPRRETTYAFRDMQVLNLADLAAPSVERVSHASSLLSFRGVRLLRGERIALRTGRIDGVHAIMVNAARSHARIALDGDRRIVKSLNLAPYAPVALEARLVPVASTLRDAGGMLGLALAEPGEPATEATMQELDVLPEGRDIVEVSDILVERGTRLLTYISGVPGSDTIDIIGHARL